MQQTELAAFSLSKYWFDKVRIELEQKPIEDLSIGFEPKGVFDKDKSEYELNLEIEIRADNNEKLIVDINCRALFVFEGVKDVKDIPDYFYTNSMAIIFPYIRAYISIITTQANVAGITIPLLNLTSLSEDLKSQTTIK